jgi:hypothetical protein
MAEVLALTAFAVIAVHAGALDMVEATPRAI